MLKKLDDATLDVRFGFICGFATGWASALWLAFNI